MFKNENTFSLSKNPLETFNFLGKFVLGYGFIFTSIIFILCTFIDRNGEWFPEDYKFIIYIAFPIIGILGFLLVKSKPYYPKEYSEYYRQIGKVK